MKKILLLITVLILMIGMVRGAYSPLPYSDEDWWTFGQDGENYFYQDSSTAEGYWGIGSVQNETTLYGMNFQPMIDDLDNDGTSEIVIFDSNLLNIFDSNFNIETQLDIGMDITGQPAISHACINVSGDETTTYPLIVFHNDTGLHVYSWNGYVLTEEFEDTFISSLPYSNVCTKNQPIKCFYNDRSGSQVDYHQCIIKGYRMGSEADAITCDPADRLNTVFIGLYYNSTCGGDNWYLDAVESEYINISLEQIISLGDPNNDGDLEYVMVSDYDQNGTYGLTIWNAYDMFTIEKSKDDIFWSGFYNYCCDWYKPPVFIDVDGGYDEIFMVDSYKDSNNHYAKLHGFRWTDLSSIGGSYPVDLYAISGTSLYCSDAGDSSCTRKAFSNFAVFDCDSDGHNEPVIGSYTYETYASGFYSRHRFGQGVRCFDDDGTMLSSYSYYEYGDDGGGSPPSHIAWTPTGELWHGGWGDYENLILASMQGDSYPDAVYGWKIYDLNGPNKIIRNITSLLSTFYEEYRAIADVTDDGLLDIIASQNGYTIVLESPTNITCYDSDLGVDYLVKGYTTDEYGTTWDNCTNSTMLGEQYCFGAYAYTFAKNCLDYGDGYSCNDGKCIPPNCVDTDGNDTSTLGKVTWYGVDYWDFCVEVGESSLVYEYYCVDIEDFDVYNVNCTASGLECSGGKCSNVSNQRPTITGATSYRNESVDFGAPYYAHHDWYTPGDRIWWEITASDPEGDDIFVAVDCDINQPPYVSGWGLGPANITHYFNCTYDTTGTYVARIYVTDTGFWGDYTNYLTDNVYIEECVTYLDCDISGYWCSGDGDCYLPSNVTNCTDSDGGLDIYTYGWITTPVETVYDECYSPTSVREYFCDPGQPGGYTSGIVSCTNMTNGICHQSICTNTTDTISVTLHTLDLDTSTAISGISYAFYQLPGGSLQASGLTSSGVASVSIELGYNYQIALEDTIYIYKSWKDLNWSTAFDVYAYMEPYCTGTCLLKEYFSYADDPFYHGWHGAEDYETYYHSSSGLVGELDLGKSVEDWWIPFRAPTDDVITIEYDIIMSNSSVGPSFGQDISVDLENDAGVDIWVMRYIVNEYEVGEVWYYDGSSWRQIQLTENYVLTQPVRTKLVYDSDVPTIDVYIDVLASGTEILYISNSLLLSGYTPRRLSFNPEVSTYGRAIYLDNIEITQSAVGPGEVEEGDPTNPSSADLDSPWYRDSNDDLKFDSSKCEGWNSMLLCAGWKYSVAKIAGGVRWIFTGVHILYFIVMLLIIIIVGPLVVEIFRKRR